nr:axoneme-associated protein mst101(2)-like [Aegilops tauschii subsp. strangulata]
MGHAHFYQRLFQLDVGRAGEVERTGKVARAIAEAGKSWVEPEDIQVQQFFDTLHEGYVNADAERQLVQDTSQAELDYIAPRAMEAQLAEEASSTGGVEDKDAADEETGVVDPPVTGRGRVLRRATSGETVRPVKVARRPKSPEESARQTRAATAKKVVKAAVAKKKASASSSPKRAQTPPSSPPPADTDVGVTFDFGDAETLAQRVKRAKASADGRPPADRSSADQEDIDAIIKDVAKDAAAEAEKVATEESTKGAAEDTAKGSVRESGKATAEEAGKGPAGESDKAAAEEEAKCRMAAVDKAEEYLKVRVAEAQTWFHQASEDLKAAQGELAKHDVELTMKLADIEKTQETVEGLAAAAEAARTQHQAALNSQEEDIAKREAGLDAKLRAKDEEVEKLVVQRTRELEQGHREALDAQDLKLKLEGLEGMLMETKAREGTMAKEMETEKQLRKNEAAEHKDSVEGVNRWIGRLEDVAGRITAQLAAMGMPNVS